MNGQPNNRPLARLVLAALVLAIPACGISSDNPLADPHKAKVDEELLGNWDNPNPDPQAFCKTLMIEKLSLPGYPPGAIKLTLIPRDPSSAPRICVGFSTELNGKRFVCQCGQLVEDLKRMPAWDKLSGDGSGIYKYQVKGKSLTLWGGHRDAIAKAVEAGKLKGKWAGGPYYSYIQLTDTTANLARFLSSDEGDALFAEQGVLKRVK